VRSQKARHYWVDRPISLIAEGYARFARINNFITNGIFTGSLWLLVGGTTIPAQVDVPLQRNSSASRQAADDARTPGEKGLPVVVFSHGMASSRTDYSQYCGELASRGYVVAAIEHRDGSGPGTIVMRHGQPDKRVFHSTLKELQ